MEDGEKITMEADEIMLGKILELMTKFLKACGFVVDELVNEKDK